MLKAVVFDSDGTLIDSFELIVSAYAHVAHEHGLRAPTAEEVREQLGKPLPEIYRTFYPSEDIDALIATNSEFFGNNVANAAGFAGLQELLEALHGLGLKLGLVTGGNHKVHDVLAHNGIEHYFGSIVHCDRGVRPKPDPESLELACHELGVEPGEVVFVGDTRQDMAVAKGAHAMAAIGITHGYGSQAELQGAGADYFVGSLPELLPLIRQLQQI